MWGYLVLKVLLVLVAVSTFNIFSAPHTYPTCIEKMFVKLSSLDSVVLEEIVNILFIL